MARKIDAAVPIHYTENMKIGKFAEKFGVNPSTVRFYIRSGLLDPERNNGQYLFNEDCVSAMEAVLRYKEFGFSLEEIQLLLFVQRAARFQDGMLLEICEALLEERKEQLIQECGRLNRCIEAIEAEIRGDRIRRDRKDPALSDPEEKSSGVPLAFLNYAACPGCGGTLSLSGARIGRGTVESGLMECRCGYRAEIREGILLCEGHEDDAMLAAFDNVDPLKSFVEEVSVEFLSIAEKVYQWIYQELRAAGTLPGVILTGPFNVNFLYEYLEKLGRQNLYIVVDPSRKKIERMRQNLMRLSGYSVVFIAGKPGSIPLRKGCADLFVDDFVTVNSLFVYDDFGVGDLAGFLKPGRGMVLGLFLLYQKTPRSLRNFLRYHPGFSPEKMKFSRLKQQWLRGGVLVDKEKIMGRTSGEEKHFPQNVVGEQLEIQAYRGVAGAAAERKVSGEQAPAVKEPGTNERKNVDRGSG